LREKGNSKLVLVLSLRLGSRSTEVKREEGEIEARSRKGKEWGEERGGSGTRDLIEDP
jgi:hypothetical protein